MECALYCEINLLCAAILFIMAYRVNKTSVDNSVKKKSFLTAIILCGFGNILDVLWELGVKNVVAFSEISMYTINSGYFVLYGIASLCWYIFSKTVGKRPVLKEKKRIVFYLIPVFVLIALSIISYFTKWFMYFDENGVYHRGPVFFVQHILAYAYLIVAAIDNVKVMLSRKEFADKDTYSTLILFAVPPVVSVFLQIAFQNLPVLSTFPAISFLLVYTNSLQIQISLDPLTGIFNRRKFLMELSEAMRNSHKYQHLYLFFIDLDEFKNINDTYGHYDGDVILQLVADSLQSVCISDGICTRYGGDEFAILKNFHDENNVPAFCDHVKQAIEERRVREKIEYNVGLSIGYTKVDTQNDTVKSLIQRADKAMYESKRKPE